MTEDPRKSRFRTNLKDVALFGRVVSAGLVVAGYVFMGVYLAQWLEGRGYPDWAVSLTPVGTALFGLWQGWLFLTRLTRREKAQKDQKSGDGRRD